MPASPPPVLTGLVYRNRVRSVLERADWPRTELGSLSQLLAYMEQEELRSARLAALKAALRSAGAPPVHAIARLGRLLELRQLKRVDPPAAILVFWKWQLIAAPFSFLLWSTHIALAIDRWRARYGPSIEHWVRIAGEFEALCAIAGYACEHPDDPFPEIATAGPLFEGEDLRHPLIPRSRCVPNTVSLNHETQVLIVSGSNMSGKSTLLRTVGVNAVLGLAGCPVRATRLRLSPLALGTTIRIVDSLQAGTSRFYAEIQRIRGIVERARGDCCVLFLLDELLHGTNSRDRAVGAAGIIRGLIRLNAIGLVTTHDLAIAQAAEGRIPRARNVHFRDELRAGRLFFDYRMHPGITEHGNALALMAAVGLDVDPAGSP